MSSSRPSRRGKPAGRPVRFWRICVAAFLLGVSSGCYTYGPAAMSPDPGTRLVLQLNDQGRVALVDSIGPTGREVEGTVVTKSDSAFLLQVARVGYLNGQSNTWNGERLTVRRSLVDRVTERRFSSSRTLLAAGIATGGVLAFILTRGLFGFGNEGRTNGGGNPNQQ